MIICLGFSKLQVKTCLGSSPLKVKTGLGSSQLKVKIDLGCIQVQLKQVSDEVKFWQLKVYVEVRKR